MSEQDGLRIINSKLDRLATEVELVKRGVYGDPQNEFKGLIQRQNEDEKDIKQIKQRQWKTGVVIGVIVVIIQAVYNFVTLK
jgi:hypothetical protein